VGWWFYASFLFYPLLVVPIVILMLFPVPRMVVHVPLCAGHRNHWRWRSHLIEAGVVTIGVLVLMVLTLSIVWDPYVDDRHQTTLALLMVVINIVLSPLPLLLIAAHIWLKYSSVYAKAIEPKRTITLTHVPEEFVEALRVQRLSLSATPSHTNP
jgi:hypothetical protein